MTLRDARIIHSCPEGGKPAGPPSVWMSGNPADYVNATCGRKVVRRDASNDPDEVTCQKCIHELAASVEATLTEGNW